MIQYEKCLQVETVLKKTVHDSEIGVKTHKTKEKKERLHQQPGSLSVLVRTWFTRLVGCTRLYSTVPSCARLVGCAQLRSIV
jgi:hypothetical protein